MDILCLCFMAIVGMAIIYDAFMTLVAYKTFIKLSEMLLRLESED